MKSSHFSVSFAAAARRLSSGKLLIINCFKATKISRNHPTLPAHPPIEVREKGL